MTITAHAPVTEATPTTSSPRFAPLHRMFRSALALGLALAAAGVLAASCGKGSGFLTDCAVNGKACSFGCVTGVGCAECGLDGDCSPGAPFCVLGKCAACVASSDCGAAEACYLRDHRCKPKCQSNADCDDKHEPICALDGACVGCRDADDCPAAAPICDVTRGQCAQCGADVDCGAAKPICDLHDGSCRGCVIDADCDAGFLCHDHDCRQGCTANGDCHEADRPICNTSTGACVGCFGNGDCGVAAPLCRADGRCAQCITDGDCGVASPYCDKDGRCAQCTEDKDCPAGDKCKDRVCEPK